MSSPTPLLSLLVLRNSHTLHNASTTAQNAKLQAQR